MSYTPYTDYLGDPLYLNGEFQLREKNFKRELNSLLLENGIDLFITENID